MHVSVRVRVRLPGARAWTVVRPALDEHTAGRSRTMGFWRGILSALFLARSSPVRPAEMPRPEYLQEQEAEYGPEVSGFVGTRVVPVLDANITY
jgi:hypothetical protein